MNITEAILTRRTAHFYTEAPVPQEVVEQALEGAIRAPNHKLTNPWRFTQIGVQTRSQVIDVVISLKDQKRTLDESGRAKVRAKLSSAPVCIVVSQVLDADPVRRKEDYASIACAIQNLSLVFWSHGVSSKWSTTGAIQDPRTYQILEIDSEDEEIVGLVFAGIRADAPNPPRRSVSDVFRQLP